MFDFLRNTLRNTHKEWNNVYSDENLTKQDKQSECTKNCEVTTGHTNKELRELRNKKNSYDGLTEKEMERLIKLEKEQIKKVKGSGSRNEALRRSQEVRDEGEWYGSCSNHDWLP